MISRPLTPPCVPLCTRRFNHIECKDLYAADMSKYPRRTSLSFVSGYTLVFFRAQVITIFSDIL